MSTIVEAKDYPDIPVSAQRDKIIASLHKHQVVVVVGDTGSGKTTQLPKMALEYVEAIGGKVKKLVGCTQPRRIAAASVSKRVAEELQVELGSEVGYQVRFDDRTSKETKLKFMTDGILLAETQADPSLKKYQVLIIDEAHERSLNIDFLLGYLKRLLQKREDLRVVISSATLDAGAFADFFDQAPVIEVEGRTFPVETHYFETDERDDLPQKVEAACSWIRHVDKYGDILVFLPGEREIRECADVLEGRGWGATEVLPLFARLGLGQQQEIFKTSDTRQRIVLATNVAETSLTIPGIVYVVDSGLARVSRWNPSRQVQRLQIEPVSQASARQRKGRCGRVRDGLCVRLYDEEDHDERDEYTDPEIRRSSLAGVILRMKSLKLPEIEEFPFLDPPSSKHIAEGYRTLREIGALSDEHQLSKVGHQLSMLPVEPRLGRMLLEAKDRRCLSELLVIVSGLSIMDPRERPQGKEQQANQAQAKWKHENSDFISLLLLWLGIQQHKDGRRFKLNQLRKHCRQGFLNFKRVQEWDNLHRELSQVCEKNLKWEVLDFPRSIQNFAHDDVIHQSILAGIPRQIGKFDKEKKAYKGAQGKEFSIFPGSGLFSKKKLEWVLAYEMVDTSKLWARRNAVLNPEWVELVAPHLCRTRWHSPYFDQKQGAVYAKEVVTCANLTIVPGRNVHFGRIQPEAAKEVFIHDAILQQQLTSNTQLLKDVEGLRDHVLGVEQKLRRREGIWSEELLAKWFDNELPDGLCTAKAFLKWEKQNEKKLTIQDVCYEDIEALDLDQFPDYLEDEEQHYPLYYKTDLGAFDDGVTIGIHIDQLSTFPDYLASWGVQGELSERVECLIRSLPKQQRIACNPAGERAEAFAELWYGKKRESSLYNTLAQHLSSVSSQRITADQFDLERLPRHSQMKFWVSDDDGNELAFSDDLAEVRSKLGKLAIERFEQSSSEEWDVSGMTSFACEDLPECIEKPQGDAFPALVDEGNGVGVKVYADKYQAAFEHRRGVVRLFLIEHRDHAKYVLKNLPLSTEVKMYLPLLGQSGVDHATILRWSVENALQQVYPRTVVDFTEAAAKAKGELYNAAEEICQILDKVVKLYREIDVKLSQWKTKDHVEEIVEDLYEQLHWMLREHFAQQISISSLKMYPVWLQGMLDRMDRVSHHPLIKDLEKMDDLLVYWSPWYDLWSERKNQHGILLAGESLLNFRTLTFSPTTQLPVKSSLKLLKKQLEEIGVSV